MSIPRQDDQGLLHETLVAWIGEFGRTAKIGGRSSPKGRNRMVATIGPTVIQRCWLGAGSAADASTGPPTASPAIRQKAPSARVTLPRRSTTAWVSTQVRESRIASTALFAFAKGPLWKRFCNEVVGFR